MRWCGRGDGRAVRGRQAPGARRTGCGACGPVRGTRDCRA
jgi:hypothetical protein